ncbi:hypothetical protein [Clostridioides sp. ES-S-0001-03]|uniref:hypothetical protein n=1 Tax=Clostridioides sp. ES-S-0001-03 TaxID=2770771 RepID=UPI001D0C0715|nr:hypothetical protein [Clostridioides sp. ES-S-0001-03]
MNIEEYEELSKVQNNLYAQVAENERKIEKFDVLKGEEKEIDLVLEKLYHSLKLERVEICVKESNVYGGTCCNVRVDEDMRELLKYLLQKLREKNVQKMEEI